MSSIDIPQLRKELKIIIQNKDSKKLQTFLTTNTKNIFHIIFANDTTNELMQSIVESFKTQAITNVVRFIHLSSNSHIIHFDYTPTRCILQSNISNSKKSDLITATFTIYRNDYFHFGESLMRDLLTYATPSLIENILTNHIAVYNNCHYATDASLTSARKTKLTALLARSDLITTFFEHKNIIPLIFLAVEKTPSIEILHLISLLLDNVGHSYYTTEILHTEKKCALLCTKLLEIYQNKMGLPATYKYVGQLLLDKIINFEHPLTGIRASGNLQIKKIAFILDIIPSDDLLNCTTTTATTIVKIASNSSATTSISNDQNETIRTKCDLIASCYPEYFAWNNMQLFKYFMCICKSHGFHLGGSTLSHMINWHNRIEMILWNIKIGYHNDLFYEKLSKEHIQTLKTMQTTQLTNLRTSLDTHLTEKGLSKIISNYIGIDKLFL